MPPDYCFPFQLEMIDVLRAAMEHDPTDAMAPLYLGNLLYDFQPEAAIEEWEKASELGSKVATVYRNLGVGYERTLRDREQGHRVLREGRGAGSHGHHGDPRAGRGLPKRPGAGGEAPGNAPEHHETLVADEYTMPLASEIELYALTGEYDKALSMMRSHHFYIWEGGEGLHTTFVDANLLRGLELLKAGQAEEARAYFEAAAEFPLNMEAKKYYAGGRSCEVFYYQGVFYETIGDEARAREAFERAVAERQYADSYGPPHFYRGQALKKLGRADEAKPLFEALIARGRRELAEIETTTGISFFAKFGDQLTDDIRRSNAHYLIGLGFLGLGEKDKAQAEFTQAADFDIYNLWARVRAARED